MNDMPLRFLLLADGCKDARFLQKAITDDGSFECDLVKIAELKGVLTERAEQPQILLLRSAESGPRLSSALKRIREIASNIPVLVLPEGQDGLVRPPVDAGDAPKSNGHDRLNLKNLARILRCGLRQSQSESELSHLAISDELTGLYNRRGFLLLGSERMRLAHAMRKNVLLFFADLDNLKQINDQFGPQEGDQALLKTADAFRKTFRNCDITARFGGQEFTALVIEDFGHTSDAISKRLQDNMAELSANNTQYPLSLSVGMTRYAAEFRSSLKRLLTQADRVLSKQEPPRRPPAGRTPPVMFPGSRYGHSQRDFRASGASVVHRSHGKSRKSSVGTL